MLLLGLGFALLSTAPGFGAVQTASLLNGLPLRFEANRGQADPRIRYMAHGAGFSLSLDHQGIVLNLRSRSNGASAMVGMRLAGARKHAAIDGVDRTVTQTTYILGEQTIQDVPSFRRVRYRGVYPGIDLMFYGNGRELEYDVLAAPGSNVSAVRFELSGILGARVDEAGNLVLASGIGEIVWKKPVIYQLANGARNPIDGRFLLKGSRLVGFDVGRYDHSQPLVIDPALSYSTYLGGSQDESARGIAVDSQGNVYIAGFTNSPNLPFTANSFQPAYAGGSTTNIPTGDAFIAKINPEATAVIYNTYLGGSGDDIGMALAIDSTGAAYVTGFTDSTNFPTKNSTRRYAGGGTAAAMTFHTLGDAFITKLNPAGNALVYSTYLGGNLDDAGTAIAVNSAGIAFVAGITLSTNFPVTPSAYQTTFGGTGGNPEFCAVCGPDYEFGDAFVASVSADGSSFNFVTYLGGSQDDMASAIAVDPTGVYVGGSTLSSNFPTTAGAFQRTYAGASPESLQPVLLFGDAYVAKLSLDGKTLLHSTYIGGNYDDAILSIALDPTTPNGPSAVYATGFTESSNFPDAKGSYHGPTSDPNGKAVTEGDVFVAKLASGFNSLDYAILIGGSFDDAGQAIAIDGAGDAIVAGSTYSSDFPVTTGALQQQPSGSLTSHGFLLKLDPTGSNVLYSTSINGNGDQGEIAFGVVLDASGNAYVTGMTDSSNFPVTAGVFQPVFGGGTDNSGPVGDAFIMKVSGMGAAEHVSVAAVDNAASYATGSVSPGEIVTIFGGGMGGTTLVTAEVNQTTGELDTTLNGTTVTFGNTPAPLVYASATQVSAIVPYELAGQASTQMTVQYNGASSSAVTIAVVTAGPGVFTANASGSGAGAILNQDSTYNTASNPAKPGDIIVLYGTGEGQLNPPGVTGSIASGPTYPNPVLPVSVSIGGIDATAGIAYAGSAPTFVEGLLQINVKVPQVGAGPQPLVVKIGNFTSQANVTVYVQ
jgi:uncharacterized protein (TIGR03437 family)